MNLRNTSIFILLALLTPHISRMQAAVLERTKARTIVTQTITPQTVATQTRITTVENEEAKERGVFSMYCRLWDGCGYLIAKDKYTELNPALVTKQDFEAAHEQALAALRELWPHRKKHEYLKEFREAEKREANLKWGALLPLNIAAANGDCNRFSQLADADPKLSLSEAFQNACHEQQSEMMTLILRNYKQRAFHKLRANPISTAIQNRKLRWAGYLAEYVSDLLNLVNGDTAKLPLHFAIDAALKFKSEGDDEDLHLIKKLLEYGALAEGVNTTCFVTWREDGYKDRREEIDCLPPLAYLNDKVDAMDEDWRKRKTDVIRTIADLLIKNGAQLTDWMGALELMLETVPINTAAASGNLEALKQQAKDNPELPMSEAFQEAWHTQNTKMMLHMYHNYKKRTFAELEENPLCVALRNAGVSRQAYDEELSRILYLAKNIPELLRISNWCPSIGVPDYCTLPLHYAITLTIKIGDPGLSLIRRLIDLGANVAEHPHEYYEYERWKEVESEDDLDEVSCFSPLEYLSIVTASICNMPEEILKKKSDILRAIANLLIEKGAELTDDMKALQNVLESKKSEEILKEKSDILHTIANLLIENGVELTDDMKALRSVLKSKKSEEKDCFDE